MAVVPSTSSPVIELSVLNVEQPVSSAPAPAPSAPSPAPSPDTSHSPSPPPPPAHSTNGHRGTPPPTAKAAPAKPKRFHLSTISGRAVVADVAAPYDRPPLSSPSPSSTSSGIVVGGGLPLSGYSHKHRRSPSMSSYHGLARARFILIAISSATVAVAAALIIAALFSVSFRTVDVPTMNGKKYFGLFRFCWEPYLAGAGGMAAAGYPGHYGTISGTVGTTCYIRTTSAEQARPGYTTNNEIMFEFEKTTLVLVVAALVLGVGAICFALCTIFSEICALAHSTLVLASAICASASFGVYTYNNEQPDLLGENDKGSLLVYHYGWGYYYSGVAALLLFSAFMISIFASSVFFYHKRLRTERRSNIKRTTVKL